MNRLAFITIASFVLFGWFTLCDAQVQLVGIVKVTQGDAFIVRQDNVLKAETNMPIKAGDRLRTGGSGKMGLVFEDDTVVSLGPGSEFVVEDFLFEPLDNKFSFVARLYRGIMSFISGQIAKLAKETVRIETPHATVGLRGTHILVKVED